MASQHEGHKSRSINCELEPVYINGIDVTCYEVLDIGDCDYADAIRSDLLDNPLLIQTSEQQLLRWAKFSVIDEMLLELEASEEDYFTVKNK